MVRNQTEVLEIKRFEALHWIVKSFLSNLLQILLSPQGRDLDRFILVLDRNLHLTGQLLTAIYKHTDA